MIKGSIEVQQQRIVEDFRLFAGDDQAICNYVMELGEAMAPLDSADRVDAYLLPGCLARVWLVVRCKDGRLFVKGDSNAAIIKGIIALFVEVFSGQLVTDVLNCDLFFPEEIGLNRLLSLRRGGGLTEMWRRIQATAKDFLGKE